MAPLIYTENHSDKKTAIAFHHTLKFSRQKLLGRSVTKCTQVPVSFVNFTKIYYFTKIILFLKKKYDCVLQNTDICSYMSQHPINHLCVAKIIRSKRTHVNLYCFDRIVINRLILSIGFFRSTPKITTLL